MNRFWLSLGVLFTLHRADAQSVSSPIRIAKGEVNPTPGHTVRYAETAIIASPADYNQAIVVFNRLSTDTPNLLLCAVKTRAGFNEVFPDTPDPLPAPLTRCGSTLIRTGDPLVAASADGTMFGGGMAITGTTPGLQAGLYIVPTSLGSPGWGTPINIPCTNSDLAGWGRNFSFDRPWMGIGPWPDPQNHDNDEMLFMVAVNVQQSGPSGQEEVWRELWSMHSGELPPLGHNWPDEHEPGFPAPLDAELVTPDPDPPPNTNSYQVAHWPSLVVLQSGPHSGRVVVAFERRTTSQSIQTYPRLPAVSFTDTAGNPPSAGGPRWAPLQSLNAHSLQALPIYPPVFGVHHRKFSSPSIAASPLNQSHVYVAFAGFADEARSHSDIFIARSTTGAAPDPSSGTLGFPPADTVRITDDMIATGNELGATSEDMPALVIDQYGGINLLYYARMDAWQTPLYFVRYARWPSFDSLKNGDAAYVANLVGPAPHGAFGGAAGNDYQMIAAAGCRLYAAYASDVSGTWDVYVTVIYLPNPDPSCDCPCVYDTDGDGLASLNDLSTYMAARAAGLPLSDVNRDHNVNVQDDAMFFNALSNALQP